MHSPETIASRISEYIQARPAKNVSGTELAQFLKFSFPGFSPFDFGVPRLRVFVERYVPEIAPIGRSGGDLLYGVRPPRGPEQQTETNVVNAPAASPGPSPHSEMSMSTMNHQLWKSFSSPNSLWHIYANTETGDIQVIAPGGPGLPAPWVVIPPLPADVHLQIAKSFIATLSDEKQRDALQALLVQSRWWDRITRPEQILESLPQAMRVLTDPADCGPVTLALPQDVQAEAYDYPEAFFRPRCWRPRRSPAELAVAAAALSRARAPLIIAGGGVHYSFACDALAGFAARHDLPVAETQAGKGALRWDHPCAVGAIGVTGGTAANALAAEADVILAIGTRLSDFTTASRSLFANPAMTLIQLNAAGFDAVKHGALPLVAA